jgi:hypothetical protein
LSAPIRPARGLAGDDRIYQKRPSGPACAAVGVDSTRNCGAATENPLSDFGIALDVSRKNGINISPTGYFGSFVPEHLFQTGSLAFQSLGKRHPEQKRHSGEIPRAIGDSG